MNILRVSMVHLRCITKAIYQVRFTEAFLRIESSKYPDFISESRVTLNTAAIIVMYTSHAFWRVYESIGLRSFHGVTFVDGCVVYIVCQDVC